MKSKLIKSLILTFCLVLLVSGVSSCAENEISKTEEYSYTDAVNKLNTESKSNNYIFVSFEGLGIEPIVINKAAFTIGNFTASWYGIIIIAAIAVALIYAFFLSKKENIKTDDFFDILIYGTIAAMIGSRLYYVLTSLDKFKGKSFWSVFEIWDGGAAIFGAIIGCMIAIYIVCKVKKINVMTAFDTVAPAALLGQVIGRWGDFFNGSSYGYELRDGDLLYGIRMGVYPHLGTESGIEASVNSIAYVHPTFLYESIWNLIGLVILSVFCRKKKFDGQKFYFYMAWYGFGRTFIEILRTDSLYIFESIKISALVGCIFFFAGVALLIYGFIQGKKIRLANEEYESAYPLFHTKSTVDSSVNADKNSEKEDTETDNGKGETKNEVD